MYRYKNEGYKISIDLSENYDGYSVECTYLYDKTNEKYLLTMGLMCKDIENMHKIDSQYISSTKETIKSDILRIVEYATSIGYFERYIHDYEYVLQCFDKGSELFEEERKLEKEHMINDGKV